MHIHDRVLTDGRIDPFKLDAVSRLGGDWYARINAQNIFSVPKPLEKQGIGIDQLPDAIRYSRILSGNDLAKLANVSTIPFSGVATSKEEFHRKAKALLEQGKTNEAWQMLMNN
jgi:hypothetical protein